VSPADPPSRPTGPYNPIRPAGDEVPLGDIPELDQGELRADTLEFEPVSRRAPKKPKRWRLPVMILIIAGAGYGAWEIWGQELTGPAPEEIPLVKAPEGQIKVRPDTPGGIDIPNRDKLVYDRLEKDPPERQAENLLPTPEKPMPAPAAAAEEQAKPAEGGKVENILPDERPTASISPETPGGVEVAERPAVQVPEPPKPEETPVQLPEIRETVPAEQKSKTDSVAQAAVSAPQKSAAKPAPVAKPVTPEPKAEAKPKPQETASTDSSGYSVQLAAVREESAARREWSRLQKRHPDLLGSLSLQVVKADLGSRGIFYRLRAGPIRDKDKAAQLCADLKKQKLGCLVIRPGR